MARPYHFGVKRMAAALALSGFVASGVSAVAFRASRMPEIQVNRVHKGDRLIQPLSQKRRISPALKRPLGCDAAFSPVAEPERAHIFRRCMA